MAVYDRNVVLEQGGKYLDENGNVLDVLRVKDDIAQSQTDDAIVAAVSGYKIRVLAFIVHAGGTATNFTFTSKPSGAGTAISHVIQCGANGGEAASYNRHGWFETAASEGLSGTTGAGSTVGVCVTYVKVPTS